MSSSKPSSTPRTTNANNARPKTRRHVALSGGMRSTLSWPYVKSIEKMGSCCSSGHSPDSSKVKVTSSSAISSAKKPVQWAGSARTYRMAGG